jgi:sugar (pentulose or hexulose) kinase
MDQDLVIGFDVGTSSLKLIVLNITNDKIELELSESTYDAIIQLPNKDLNEQNLDIILKITYNLFEKIPKIYWKRLKAIQLCGQMHGIILWNTNTKIHSNLVTWQG